MTHILLTGAGFSRNWGGWLASEAFEFLLSVTQGDNELRNLLWREHGAHFGFEDILAKLQHEYVTKWSAQCEQNLRNLTSAVQLMFADIFPNSVRAGPNFRIWCHQVSCRVRRDLHA